LDAATTAAPSESLSELRGFEEGGVRPLRLAEALSGTPVTPLVGTMSHHQMHQAMVAAMACPQLHVGPRQLDFGVLPKQAWPGCPGIDMTPSAAFAMSPITPAPRTRPVLHQTVFENETPDRPQYHALSQHHFVQGEKEGFRYPSPSEKENREPRTPPRTPPRKGIQMELVEMPVEGSDVSLDPSGVQLHRSPPSVAKTPYGCGWVGSTPSPQPNLYRGGQAPVLADTTNTQFVDPRSQYLVAEMPPIMPQQLQYTMHHTHAMPWGMFSTTC